MRPEFLDLLCCPTCTGELQLTTLEGHPTTDDGHVMEGTLHCEECDAAFPVERGVPRLLPDDKNRSAVRDNTAARFAYEWHAFSDFELEEETKSMATWLSPKKLSDLEGLTVFDAGCGMGRHATIAVQHGVGRVVGLDLGDAVDAAFANTRHLPNVCIVQSDIYHPAIKNERFEAGYSIGVLHHLPEPRRGFHALASKVKPGGWFQVWVYAHEGNQLLLSVLNPVRQVTSRMPLGFLKALSAAIAAPVALASKTVYRLPALGRRLPYSPYMQWLSTGCFEKIHAIVFDQLLAPVAHYMTRRQTLEMVTVDGWRTSSIEHSRGMSWGVTALRQPAVQVVPVPAPRRAA